MWWRWFLRVLVVLAASWPVAVVADELLSWDGIQPLPCFPPSDFWAMFETCDAPSGEHLFGVAALTAAACTTVWIITGRLVNRRQHEPPIPKSDRLVIWARSALSIAGAILIVSILGLITVPREPIFVIAVAGAVLAALSVPVAVPRRFLGIASAAAVFTLVFVGVASTGLFSEQWVS